VMPRVEVEQVGSIGNARGAHNSRICRAAGRLACKATDAANLF